MTISVSQDVPRHPRLRAWLDKDGNRVGIWITEPRVTLATP